MDLNRLLNDDDLVIMKHVLSMVLAKYFGINVV